MGDTCIDEGCAVLQVLTGKGKVNMPAEAKSGARNNDAAAKPEHALARNLDLILLLILTASQTWKLQIASPSTAPMTTTVTAFISPNVVALFILDLRMRWMLPLAHES